MSISTTLTEPLFGTDGIRGTVGRDPITSEFAFRIGRALAQWLSLSEKDLVLIGGDTRQSTKGLGEAMLSGLKSHNVGVVFLGVMPTPAISYLTRNSNAVLGIAVTASHNPYTDNGYKFFDRDGVKLSYEAEREVTEVLGDTKGDIVNTSGAGTDSTDYREDYLDYCLSTLTIDTDRLKNLRVVVDCANGSCSQLAQDVFARLSMPVDYIGVRPNGTNINEHCGATDPTLLQIRVGEAHADIGIAFDGDGDRIVAVDSEARLLDGDLLLFMLAKRLKSKGLLRGGVVGTDMSNLALQKAIEVLGIPFERTKVGDRNVAAKMRENSWNLGGENSGHLILSDLSPTGDGLLVALQLMEILADDTLIWRSLHDEIVLFPQIQDKIQVNDPRAFSRRDDVRAIVQRTIDQTTSTQRIIARPSGTEPVFRIMVEGAVESEVKETVTRLLNNLQPLANQ